MRLRGPPHYFTHRLQCFASRLPNMKLHEIQIKRQSEAIPSFVTRHSPLAVQLSCIVHCFPFFFFVNLLSKSETDHPCGAGVFLGSATFVRVTCRWTPEDTINGAHWLGFRCVKEVSVTTGHDNSMTDSFVLSISTQTFYLEP